MNNKSPKEKKAKSKSLKKSKSSEPEKPKEKSAKGKKEKQPKQKKEKPEGQLKKPQTAYFLFCADKRAEDKDKKWTAKELGELYKNLPVSEKEVYKKRHDEEMKAYEKEKASLKEKGAEGYGTYTWENGNKYEGNWKHYMRNGHGKLTTVDGEVYEGEWYNDESVG